MTPDALDQVQTFKYSKNQKLDVNNLFNMKNKAYELPINTAQDEEDLQDPFVLRITGKT